MFNLDILINFGPMEHSPFRVYFKMLFLAWESCVESGETVIGCENLSTV